MSENNLEMCCNCDEPTGNAGEMEDSLFLGDWGGPYCDNCFGEAVPELADAYGVVKAQALSLQRRVEELEGFVQKMVDMPFRPGPGFVWQNLWDKAEAVLAHSGGKDE